MQTKSTKTNPSIFDLVNAQRRAESNLLRSNPPNKASMNKLRMILLVLLGAAAPLLIQAQTTETYTFTTNRLVPDGNTSGLSEVHSLNSAIGTIGSVTVALKITGEFNGDLYGYLRHASGFTVLLNRPGKTATNLFGYADSGLDVIFQTGAANGDIHVYQSLVTPAPGLPLTGAWQPDGRDVDPTNVTDTSVQSTSLTNFNGLNAAGQWTLYLADLNSGGTNLLTEWSLNITGAAYPALSWANPADIVYGTALGGSQLNATATYNSTNVPGTFSYTPPLGAVLNAGQGQTLTVTFTPSDTNSFLPISAQVTLNVDPAPLTITANDASTVYGAALPALTASYSGFVNGDTAASLTSPVSLSTTAATASPVGTYAITASGAADANYTITEVNGTLSVTPAPLTITADNQSKVYGAALPTLTASYSGFVNGDTAASFTSPVTLATTATAASPVGTYTITPSGAADANYTITEVNGTLSVTPASLTIAADNKSKTYGAALPVFTATYSGFVNGDTVASLTSPVILGTAATVTSPVGTYPITATGAADANYTITELGGTLTIVQSLTTGAIASSANPALPGSTVTFTLAVSPVAPGAGMASGTVNFRIDGSIAGSGALSGGVASFGLTTLTHGSHTVLAEYAGDLNFIGVTNSLTPPQIINTPPVAGSLTIQRYPTGGVKVRLPTLLANASDADGDTLNIAVSSGTANGGTITVSSGWVFYTPAAGYTNADAFSYTVTDGWGGSATGAVTVAIEVDNAPGQNLTITSQGPNTFLLDGSGIPGRTYRLQSTDASDPANWQDIPGASVTADAEGAFQFIDTTAWATPLYRSVFP
ncbi:conserved exported hypothetical protein [Verrucomicrobia bacterium]|nr:conserved exported hypothetical protein [Verrucomicrobiota bacterium]